MHQSQDRCVLLSEDMICHKGLMILAYKYIHSNLVFFLSFHYLAIFCFVHEVDLLSGFVVAVTDNEKMLCILLGWERKYDFKEELDTINVNYKNFKL